LNEGGPGNNIVHLFYHVRSGWCVAAVAWTACVATRPYIHRDARD
jgi:hypothetical protein